MESWFNLPAEQRFSTLISTLNHDIRNIFFAFIFSYEPKTQGRIRKEFLNITKLDEIMLTKGNVIGLCARAIQYGFLAR